MDKKTVLVIGSGGREHALGWKLKQSPYVGKMYFTPGNAGTVQLGENIDIKASEIDKLLNFVLKNKIDFTLVGPEDPLALGIVDLFEKKGLVIFGPTKKASKLESSKSWAAEFMKRNNIPQPISFSFKNDKDAILFIKNVDASNYVIKASGLAMGKGVILPQSQKEAVDTINKIMIKKEFGDAGNEIVIQEKLVGQEVSVIAFSDGKTVVPMLAAQDHKRAYDHDKGPNTGGMGAYAPAQALTPQLMKIVQKTILQKTIDAMKKEGYPYKGVLYAGLMITKNGPKVLEYNVRFGDPETQPVMMLLESDLFLILQSCINETLHKEKIKFSKDSSICVVLASKGYPGKYNKGEVIRGLNGKYDTQKFIFHAGTATNGDQIVTNGGRVLGVTATGKNIQTAIKNAYSIIGKKRVSFKGMQYRKDIGYKVED